MEREPNEVSKQEGQTLNNQKSTKMRKGRAKKRQVLPDPRYGEKRRINQNEDNDSTELNDLEVKK